MTEVMVVLHANGRLYFCSVEPEAIADAQLWRDRGKIVRLFSFKYEPPYDDGLRMS